MAKAKKGGKKKKKSMAREDFGSLSFDQVAAQGDQWLAADNARDALRAFKFLKKSGYDPGTVCLRLFQAYLVRYGQLMEKKMVNEADVVLASALEFFPTGGCVSFELLEIGVRLLPLERGVALYRTALLSMAAVPEMERLIGIRAALEDNLDALDILPGHLALVREKACLGQAMVSMNGGQWDQALKDLNPIARKSPFADIKIFAKLMAAFAAQDKSGIQKALSMLDKGFPLTFVRDLLDAYATGDGGLPTAPPAGKETATVLWGQSFLNEGHAGALKKGVAENNPAKINRAIAGLTARFDGPEKTSAVEFLAEIAGQGVVTVTREPDQVLALFRKLPLTDPQAMFTRFVAPRIAFLNEHAAPFWRQIDQMFPDPGDQDLARGLVLVKIAERIVNDADSVFGFKDDLEDFFTAVGCEDKVCFDGVDSDGERHLVVVSILAQALIFDPQNPMAYELLLSVPFDSPALRKTLPPLLEIMAGVFPHDPRPCLRLAQIYLSKSAVRKAENALKKAFARAPHDNEVLKQYALCHVATASKNIKSRKFDLALKDLEAAEKMGAASLGVYIIEKRLLCTFVQTLKFSKKLFEETTHGLSLVDTLRVLALFKLDLEDPDYNCPDGPRGLAAVFNTHKKRIKELNSGAVASLLAPVPLFCQGLYSQNGCAACYLDKRATILNGLTDQDFMAIAMDIARYGYMDPVVGQLSRRVNTDNEDDDGISMRFLLCAFSHIRGDSAFVRDIVDMIDSVSPPLKERLRMLSRQVATLAPKPLQAAYEQFDFTLIGPPSFLDNLPFDLDPRGMDEFAQVMDRARQDGMGGVLDSFMDRVLAGGMGELLESMMDGFMDDDDGYDIDLGTFKARKVFGNRVDAREIHERVYDLVEDTLYVNDVRRAGDVADNSVDLIVSFNDLSAALRDSGLDSSDDFRRAGKRFCQDIAYGREILQAFQTASKRSSVSVSRDTLSFILGMKQGN